MPNYTIRGLLLTLSGVVGGALLMQLLVKSWRPRQSRKNAVDFVLNQTGESEYEVVIDGDVVGHVERGGSGRMWWGFYTTGNPQQFATSDEAADFVSREHGRRHEARTPFGR